MKHPTDRGESSPDRSASSSSSHPSPGSSATSAPPPPAARTVPDRETLLNALRLHYLSSSAAAQAAAPAEAGGAPFLPFLLPPSDPSFLEAEHQHARENWTSNRRRGLASILSAALDELSEGDDDDGWELEEGGAGGGGGGNRPDGAAPGGGGSGSRNGSSGALPQ
jgi:hypothetical protein